MANDMNTYGISYNTADGAHVRVAPAWRTPQTAVAEANRRIQAGEAVTAWITDVYGHAVPSDKI